MLRLLWMDRLRGAAMIAVVVLHAELSVRAASGHDLPLVHAVNGLLAPYRMPLLVALSGVLLTPALAKPWRSYLRGKVRALLWPYLVWVTLDTAYVAARAGGLGWDYVAHLAYDPKTYLWFLAYLFVFYVVSLALPSWLRIAGGPLVLALAWQADPTADWHKLAWLLGWFLVGDTLGRVVRRWLRPAPVPPRDVLGFVGRNSLVFYVSHLIVIIFVTDLGAWLGVGSAALLFVLAVAVPLVVGTMLVHARGHSVVDALFAWPSRTMLQPADGPKGMAPSVTGYGA
ncbi:acyltransferase family protein [Nocardioides allogilvus]|uniref:acyltransferase family protein n=1 Tax=Nocardioides allogilvus TaxID=2072017 RepID=UPI000D322B88|nr:acyltransferase family protein [Nocardioides allogilvus]